MKPALPEELIACGIEPRPLDPTERTQLDRQGYVVLDGVMAPALVERLRAAFDSAEIGGGRDERGTRHIDALALGGAFDELLTQGRVLAAVAHVLGGPMRLTQLGGREPQHGFGAQGLHTDAIPRQAGEPDRVVTVLWLLDDLTSGNGATRVVPGSHRIPGAVPRSFAEPGRRHPTQRAVHAPAGSVLVFNGHLWHSGTENRSGERRRIVQGVFVARAERQALGAPHELERRRSPAARWLLGG